MHFAWSLLRTSVRFLSFTVWLSGGAGRETAASGCRRPGSVTAGQQMKGVKRAETVWIPLVVREIRSRPPRYHSLGDPGQNVQQVCPNDRSRNPGSKGSGRCGRIRSDSRQSSGSTGGRAETGARTEPSPSQDPAGGPQATRRRDSRRHTCLARSPARHLDRCGGVHPEHEWSNFQKISRGWSKVGGSEQSTGEAPGCGAPQPSLTPDYLQAQSAACSLPGTTSRL